MEVGKKIVQGGGGGSHGKSIEASREALIALLGGDRFMPAAKARAECYLPVCELLGSYSRSHARALLHDALECGDVEVVEVKVGKAIQKWYRIPPSPVKAQGKRLRH
jgi:hypothetical protein